MKLATALFERFDVRRRQVAHRARDSAQAVPSRQVAPEPLSVRSTLANHAERHFAPH
ncbi:MAG TPA: hypothetical protein VFB39_17850 [Solirubrobacteraceae bacterium]|nr:hypothetical protein [Solirubrobacteraceae bacterium]